MKPEIHPNYNEVTVTCACGASFKTGSTKGNGIVKVDICNKCHPYYTGKQKLIDAGGRVDKFNKRYGL
ncbi:MAG: 50S ribosomal protein L31 [Bacillota bacterium]